MAKYANQNRVLIQRTVPQKGTKQPFLCIYNENIENASKELGGVAFKLYIYFATNSNDYSFDYSPQHFANTYGVGLTASRDAFRELIKKGYLTESATNSHYYTFTEQPQKPKATMTLKVEKRGFQTDTGELEWHTMAEVIELYISAGYTEKDATIAWDRDGVKED